MASPNVATILRDHVSLSTSCVDRLYLNGYVPRLQSTGQLCAFLCDHLGSRDAIGTGLDIPQFEREDPVALFGL
jgi:hypothetical protein